VRKTVLPGGQALTDTRRLYSGIRLRSDGRLQVSTDGPAFSNDARPALRKATRRVLDLFPQLVGVAWEKEMAGWVGMTTDQYPHLHNLAPGLWAAIGLNGRGIAFGTLLGRELAKRIAARPEHELVMPVTPLQPISVRRFARPLVGSLIHWYRFLDSRDLASGYLGAPR
jgi:glycine/D-amino acid oxidase-like deaminating enzyme